MIGEPEDNDAAGDIDIGNNFLDSYLAFGKKCENCSFLGDFSGQSYKESNDMPEEHHKSGSKQKHIGIREMRMEMSLSNTMRILKSIIRQ